MAVQWSSSAPRGTWTRKDSGEQARGHGHGSLQYPFLLFVQQAASATKISVRFTVFIFVNRNFATFIAFPHQKMRWLYLTH